MVGSLCLQCRRRKALRKAEVTLSDGRTALWHHPQVCSWCMRVLSATLECFEPEPFSRHDSVQLKLMTVK